jgi:hypothetical protein
VTEPDDKLTTSDSVAAGSFSSHTASQALAVNCAEAVRATVSGLNVAPVRAAGVAAPAIDTGSGEIDDARFRLPVASEYPIAEAVANLAGVTIDVDDKTDLQSDSVAQD